MDNAVASGSGKKRVTRKLRSAAERPPRSLKQWVLFGVKWGAIGGLAAVAVATASVALLFWIYGRDPNLPTIEKLSDYKPDQVSRVLTPEGAVVGEVYTQRRTYVEYQDIPDVVIHAFVSAEDGNFFNHKGIDYVGMVRALIVNLKSGTKKQGASTITQQVVKNLLLTRERTFKRKIQEIILARRLEHSLSKEEILTLYANEIFFGHGRYGVEEASRYYFGKHVGDLNPGEAALLAGLPKGPNLYTPRKQANQERAKHRQTYVLEQMVKNGYLSAEEAQKWIDEPIKIVRDPYPALGIAPEWVELARRELVERYGPEGVFKAGVDVRITIDLEVQRLAEQALRKTLREYDKRQHFGYPIKKLKGDAIELERARLAKKQKKSAEDGIVRAIVTKVDDDNKELLVDTGPYKASVLLGGPEDARYNPDKKPPSKRFEVGHVIHVDASKAKFDDERSAKLSERRIRLAAGPEGAIVVLEPTSRRVLAVVGGYDSRAAAFNRATQAKRQAGSTFKPFVYAAALDSGDYSPATIINDAPEVYDLWKPENYSRKFLGPVRLRVALAKSINTVAIRVAHDVGTERIAEIAHSMGIESELPEGYSMALGSGEVTPLELTNAFATFAAGGKFQRPRVLSRIGDEQVTGGEVREALSPEVAYVATQMMTAVIEEGTAGKARSLGLQIAGKTGTTNKARDAWFVGVSPALAVGVWVGYDDFTRPLGKREGGSRTALPAFIRVMKKLGKRRDRFERPAAVVEARIDKTTGLLAAEGVTEDVYTEVFLPGTVPTEIAPAPGEVGVSDAVIDEYEDE